MYLKDLHLLQRDLLTLTMVFGQMNCFQNETRVCGTRRIVVSEIWITTDSKNATKTKATCADEQDIIGAVHCFHSVHHQFTKFVVNTHSDQEGTLSQRQHTFLQQPESNNVFNCNANLYILYSNEIDQNRVRLNEDNLMSKEINMSWTCSSGWVRLKKMTSSGYSLVEL